MATASNWNISDRRVSERLSEKLCAALAEATAGFSQEHWQSWKFQTQDHFVELLMGEEYGTETVAEWREKIIRCGAALQLLKLSLKRQGCHARVKLFPELERPFLVARVYLSKGGRDREWNPLHCDTMTQGHFQPSATLPAADIVFNLMSHAVAGERCWLEQAQCQRSRERLLELAGMNEPWLFQINGERTDPPPEIFGMGQKPAGYNSWHKFILGVKLRAPVPQPEAGKELVAPDMSGTFAVVKTKTDDKHGWIAAGQTSAMLRETARKLGVSCKFFNQAFRKSSVRQELRTSIGHKGFGQAVVQLKMTDDSPANLAAAEWSAVTARDCPRV